MSWQKGGKSMSFIPCGNQKPHKAGPELGALFLTIALYTPELQPLEEPHERWLQLFGLDIDEKHGVHEKLHLDTGKPSRVEINESSGLRTTRERRACCWISKSELPGGRSEREQTRLVEVCQPKVDRTLAFRKEIAISELVHQHVAGLCKGICKQIFELPRLVAAEYGRGSKEQLLTRDLGTRCGEQNRHRDSEESLVLGRVGALGRDLCGTGYRDGSHSFARRGISNSRGGRSKEGLLWDRSCAGKMLVIETKGFGYSTVHKASIELPRDASSTSLLGFPASTFRALFASYLAIVSPTPTGGEKGTPKALNGFTKAEPDLRS
ncbi:hypothetical protein C8R45DRAFT_1147406 [Mycena sanguinolenta]|nr:hypothetical protein C8R45DRAFT_1147406 [Mycena sanguinolenta]